MKRQYFGDVTDYAKYGLLRAFADAGLSTALHWMRTPADGRSDGGRTAYLEDRARWRRHDPRLFDALRHMVVGRGERDPGAIERSRLLPRCRFFGETVPREPAARRASFERFLGCARRADLALFDPDNGLEVRSVGPGAPGSPKYLYEEEVARAWRAGLSPVVFQFFPRVERARFVRRIARRLRALTGADRVIAVVATHTVYLIVPQRRHRRRLARALGAIRERWAGALEVIELRRRAAARGPRRTAAPSRPAATRATSGSRRSSAAPRG